MTPLELLKNPELIGTMTVGQKLVSGLQVTVLGMVVVFLLLFLLMLVVRVMENLINGGQKASVRPVEKPQKTVVPKPEPALKAEGIDQKVVAAITAAIAAGCFKDTSSLRVRRIRRLDDDVPVWGRVARGGGNQARYFQTIKEG